MEGCSDCEEYEATVTCSICYREVCEHCSVGCECDKVVCMRHWVDSEQKCMKCSAAGLILPEGVRWAIGRGKFGSGS